MFDRLKKIMNEEEFKKLQEIRVLLIGVGGVGGYTLEALLRSGIKNITIIDYDTFEITNMNRQLLCTIDNINKSKVEEAKKRASLINGDAIIKAMNHKLTKEEITKDFINDYDYIIDACDDLQVKITLIEICTQNEKNFISCMGMSNRFHPELLEITKLSKTSIDPLAKKIRQALKNNKKALNTTVLCSKELPIKGVGLGTACPVPMAAGAILASYIIKKEN